jgi:hypothetical protein
VSKKNQALSINRHSLLGAAAAAFSATTMGARVGLAQTRAQTLKGEQTLRHRIPDQSIRPSSGQIRTPPSLRSGFDHLSR